MVEIHDRILSSAGTSWFDWDEFPSRWYESVEADIYVRELTAAVRKDYDDAPLFVLKDPRICRFLPLWTRVLSEIKAEPFVVIPFRNPLEVAKSLRDRNGVSAESVLLVWLRHLLDAESSSRELPRAFLSYEQFVLDGRRELDRLDSQLPLIWPRQSARAHFQIENAIEPGLRRNRASHEDIYTSPVVFDWVRTTHRAYEKLRADPSDKHALRDMDAVREAFNTACRAFAPAFQGLSIHTENLTVEISNLKAELADAQTNLKAEVADAQKRAGELEAVASQFSDLQRHRDQVEESLSSANRSLAEQSAEILSLRQELEASEQKALDLEAAALRIGELEATVAFQSEHLTKVEHELANARDENARLSTLTAEVPQLHREQHRLVVSLAAERARVNAEVSPLISRISELELELARERGSNVAANFQSSPTAVPRLDESLKETEAALKKERDAAARREAELDGLRDRVRKFETAIKEAHAPEIPGEGVFSRVLERCRWAVTLQLRHQVREQRRIEARMAILLQSGLFDPDWYLWSYPDVWLARVDPARHFCEKGYLEDRHPGPNVEPSCREALVEQLRAV